MGAGEFLFVTQCARTGNGPGATHFGPKLFAMTMQPKPPRSVLKKWPRINDTFTPFV